MAIHPGGDLLLLWNLIQEKRDNVRVEFMKRMTSITETFFFNIPNTNQNFVNELILIIITSNTIIITI
jgi:hypothetical protein